MEDGESWARDRRVATQTRDQPFDELGFSRAQLTPQGENVARLRVVCILATDGCGLVGAIGNEHSLSTSDF